MRGTDRAPGSISSRTLGFVKKLVRSFIQDREGIIVRDRCDAHARRHRPCETRNRIGDSRRDRLTAKLRLCIHVLTPKEKDELLAAKAARAHMRPSLQGDGNRLENVISGAVPVSVIDGFEMVEVDDRECIEPLRAKLLELPLNRPPVEQTCQRIGFGQAFQQIGLVARAIRSRLMMTKRSATPSVVSRTSNMHPK